MKTQGPGHRAKRIRTSEACGMKLNMYKVWDEKKQLVSVTLSRNELKFCGKDDVCYTHNHDDDVFIKLPGLPHNHTLEYLDIIKVNSKVKILLEQRLLKGTGLVILIQISKE